MPFVASDGRHPAFLLSYPFWKCRLNRRIEQHGDLDVATQSLQATIEKIVAAAIRLETKNHLPDLGSAALSCHYREIAPKKRQNGNLKSAPFIFSL